MMMAQNAVFSKLQMAQAIRSFLLTSSSVPSSSTEFSFCICDSEVFLEKISHSSVASSSDINRVFFLRMRFRSLFGKDCTFFCGIIIWHQHSFLFACVFQKFVWRSYILWHHHHQHSFLLHVFSEVCLEKFAFCCHHHHHHHHHFCFLFFFFMCLRNKTSSCFGSGKPGRQRTIFFTQDGDGDGDNSARKRQS